MGGGGRMTKDSCKSRNGKEGGRREIFTYCIIFLSFLPYCLGDAADEAPATLLYCSNRIAGSLHHAFTFRQCIV